MNEQCSRMPSAAALRERFFIAIFLFTLAALFHPTLVARAASITVDTLVDEDLANGNCSLHEAITAANTNAAYRGCIAGTAGMDTIGFSLPGTITLSTEREL